jgi:hypothetical protein
VLCAGGLVCLAMCVHLMGCGVAAQVCQEWSPVVPVAYLLAAELWRGVTQNNAMCVM